MEKGRGRARRRVEASKAAHPDACLVALRAWSAGQDPLSLITDLITSSRGWHAMARAGPAGAVRSEPARSGGRGYREKQPTRTGYPYRMGHGRSESESDTNRDTDGAWPTGLGRGPGDRSCQTESGRFGAQSGGNWIVM